MTNLPLSAIKRIASVKGKKYRVGKDAVVIIDYAATEWIRKLAEESFVFSEHAKRRTLKAVDVIPVLEKMGIKIPVNAGQPVKQKQQAKPKKK